MCLSLSHIDTLKTLSVPIVGAATVHGVHVGWRWPLLVVRALSLLPLLALVIGRFEAARLMGQAMGLTDNVGETVGYISICLLLANALIAHALLGGLERLRKLLPIGG